MIEPLDYPWPAGDGPRRVQIAWAREDGTITTVVTCAGDDVAGYLGEPIEGATAIVLPATPKIEPRLYRVDNGRIVERDEPLLTEQERREKAVRETAEIPEGASILEHRLAALERAIAGLDIPEADEVRRIRAALDGAEAPQSKDRES